MNEVLFAIPVVWAMIVVAAAARSWGGPRASAKEPGELLTMPAGSLSNCLPFLFKSLVVDGWSSELGLWVASAAAILLEGVLLGEEDKFDEVGISCGAEDMQGSLQPGKQD